MKKLLRLWVMTKINHSQEYVQGAMTSQGIDYKSLNHEQITCYKNTLKQIEADTMIEIAFAKDNKTKISEIDLLPILNPDTPKQ